MSHADFTLAGISDVSDERLRQITNENYSAAKDDELAAGALASAGLSYTAFAIICLTDGTNTPLEVAGPPPDWWPFEADQWKPAASPRENLVKAAALLIAEIDRIDRKNSSPPGSKNA